MRYTCSIDGFLRRLRTVIVFYVKERSQSFYIISAAVSCNSKEYVILNVKETKYQFDTGRSSGWYSLDSRSTSTVSSSASRNRARAFKFSSSAFMSTSATDRSVVRAQRKVVTNSCGRQRTSSWQWKPKRSSKTTATISSRRSRAWATIVSSNRLIYFSFYSQINLRRDNGRSRGPCTVLAANAYVLSLPSPPWIDTNAARTPSVRWALRAFGSTTTSPRVSGFSVCRTGSPPPRDDPTGR